MENRKNFLRDEKGFTLIEVISVLIILGVLAATAVPKYVALDETAKDKAVDAGISELNGREKLMWARFLISGVYKDDADLFKNSSNSMIAGGYYDLGANYTWGSSSDLSDTTIAVNPDADGSGGALRFQNMKIAVKLIRNPSTANQPAIWIRYTSP